MSDMFDVGKVFDITLSLMTLTVIAGAFAGLVTSILALRAKRRARRLLEYEVALRRDIERLLAEDRDPEAVAIELARAFAEIEKKLTSLPAKDREFISEGLHQQSRAGARRYASEILNAA